MVLQSFDALCLKDFGQSAVRGGLGTQDFVLTARLVSEPERDKRHESLSGREKEVIACVVQGMTNKQIADKLFISTHTVITHRRNISAKLGIHSPAGLTIYAIVNKLVELDDIKDSVEEQLPGD